MANKLVKNETNIYYTITVNDESYLRNVEFYSGRVDKVDLRPVTGYSIEPWKAPNQEAALKVARAIGGKITKHTRTEVITEVTEEIVSAEAKEDTK